MIDAAALTAELKKLVLVVEDDLRARLDGPDDDRREAGGYERWRAEYDEAFAAERTGRTWTQWRDDRVTQAAVAWVLTTVFVRFCEDNALVAPVWIEGPKARRQEAQDARSAYFRIHPTHEETDWLRQPVEYLAGIPAAKELVESHSPLWTVAPSGRAAETILAFWHARDDAGDLRWDFTDEGRSTRFLGDLYQDLSEHAKSTYALLQTPEFVEEFILERTLTPALTERPLQGFRLIDPTCGSGHFLLGAFGRLFARWRAAEPGTNAGELARRALESVHGVDLNPFAVAIARFRLVIAAVKAAGETDLERAPDWPLNLAVGDSLLNWGNEAASLTLGDGYDADTAGFAYATEDRDRLWCLLKPGSYDVVVGNPPYITVKDKALNQRYRTIYTTTKGKYALTVPFMERFFGLARRGDESHPAGWVGQITSNSFMKREFGSKLIEEFLPRQDLRLVVDTSGAYIPGHGTPTVILVGRPGCPVGDTVRAVLGIRGEPGRPADASQGVVWRSIVDHIDEVGHEDEYTSTSDLSSAMLYRHPWTLSGGAAPMLTSLLNDAPGALRRRIHDVGSAVITRADDAFSIGDGMTPGLPPEDIRNFQEGEDVRDWEVRVSSRTIWTYDSAGGQPGISAHGRRQLWLNRSLLRRRVAYGRSQLERGLEWYEYSMIFPNRLVDPRIVFSSLATHNHFSLDRSRLPSNRWALSITLPEGASEDEHLALLGVLNSSTACFWLKQNSHNKGNEGYQSGIKSEHWEKFYEFTGTTLKDFPLPAGLPLSRARQLDEMARTLPTYLHSAVPTYGRPHSPLMARMAKEEEELRRRMIAVQEELDWEVYSRYGLLDENLTLPEGETLPEVALGERAFEIALARTIAAGTESSAWFERHGSTPVTETPVHWPEPYRQLVQRRLDLIESDRFIGLLERPEYKRRWASEPWEKRVEKALRRWLLDRLEDRDLWFQRGRPRPMSVAQLADQVGTDEDLVATLELWAGRKDADLVATLEKLLADEVVPYLAAYRLKEPGMRKRAEWERTWELQRAEDSGEDVGTIAVPPKYVSADFRKQSVWSHRGKLDVPKERFISYPEGSRPTDPTTMIGWAGWDHAHQSVALATLIHERSADGVPEQALVPLVAGMAELQPWVAQWHGGPEHEGVANVTAEALRGHMQRLGVTEQDLRAWRAPAPTRGRRKKN